ncbi:MAG: hypothetical protein M1826_002953 [Phylliscum demangeonii]|nr:MAG: hypothetical protein M1826_002953 [Phylliscum demangeonii]
MSFRKLWTLQAAIRLGTRPGPSRIPCARTIWQRSRLSQQEDSRPAAERVHLTTAQPLPTSNGVATAAAAAAATAAAPAATETADRHAAAEERQERSADSSPAPPSVDNNGSDAVAHAPPESPQHGGASPQEADSPPIRRGRRGASSTSPRDPRSDSDHGPAIGVTVRRVPKPEDLSGQVHEMFESWPGSVAVITSTTVLEQAEDGGQSEKVRIDSIETCGSVCALDLSLAHPLLTFHLHPPPDGRPYPPQRGFVAIHMLAATAHGAYLARAGMAPFDAHRPWPEDIAVERGPHLLPLVLRRSSAWERGVEMVLICHVRILRPVPPNALVMVAEVRRVLMPRVVVTANRRAALQAEAAKADREPDLRHEPDAEADPEAEGDEEEGGGGGEGGGRGAATSKIPGSGQSTAPIPRTRTRALPRIGKHWYDITAAEEPREALSSGWHLGLVRVGSRLCEPGRLIRSDQADVDSHPNHGPEVTPPTTDTDGLGDGDGEWAAAGAAAAAAQRRVGYRHPLAPHHAPTSERSSSSSSSSSPPPAWRAWIPAALRRVVRNAFHRPTPTATTNDRGGARPDERRTGGSKGAVGAVRRRGKR